MAAASSLRIALLGGFRVVVDGRPVPDQAWRQRRAAAIIKLLALEPGHRLHREQLMEWLWPEFDAPAQANTLRQMLFRAREQLAIGGADIDRYLVRDGDMLVLGPHDEVNVDADDFQRAAVAAWRSDDPASFEHALALYRGDLLPDDRYEEWAESPRARLRTTALSLRARLAELHEQHGDATQAIWAWRQLVAQAPAHEAAHRAIIRLLATGGQPAEALAQYEQLAGTLRHDLEIEPDPTTRALVEEIRQSVAAAPVELGDPVAGPATPLPEPPDALIGRERELAEAGGLLLGSRLLVLTGPGGIGKTRLALALARATAAHFADGVTFVDLGEVREPAFVAHAIAQALGIRVLGDADLGELLLERLRDRRMLLVLDTFEHLVEAAPLLASLLHGAQTIRVLVTSRVRLRLRGEREYPIGPLDVPDPAEHDLDALARYPAVRLFVERAREIDPAFALTGNSAPLVAEICRRLDGLPLAIELAAARTRLLTLGELLARLERPLGILTGGSRDLPERQRTMRATIRWSHDLLAPQARALFARLSVFAGGWTLAAAEAITELDGGDGSPLLDDLQALVDANLVVVRPQPNGESRFQLLDPLREFSSERLAERGEADDLARRHRDWFLGLVERSHAESHALTDLALLQRVIVEMDNLRAAYDTSLRLGDVEHAMRLLAALWPSWAMIQMVPEGWSRAQRLLAHPDAAAAPPELRVRALNGAAVLAQNQGAYERAIALDEEVLALARRIGDRISECTALSNMCACASRMGDVERTVTICDEALQVARELDYRIGILSSAYYRGIAMRSEAEFAHSRALLEESLAICREVGNPLVSGWVLAGLSKISAGQGDAAAARGFAHDALALGEQVDDPWSQALARRVLARLALANRDLDAARRLVRHALGNARSAGLRQDYAEHLELLAQIELEAGDPARATRLLGTAARLRAETGSAILPVDAAAHEHVIATLREQLTPTRFTEQWNIGRAQTLDDALAPAGVSTVP